MSREIFVDADWEAIREAPRPMGILRSTETRGREIFSFGYNGEWLARGDRLTLDPDLRFFQGEQYLSADRPNFGIFLDSSPDRWGRLLMQRREAANASREGRTRGVLRESDYLLGVHDGQRLGGLRFRVDPNGPSLDNQYERAAPPSTSLRALQQASWRVQDPDSDSTELSEWIDLLIAPGSSLVGARPKAGVQYPNGDLWIAKFPDRSDTRDIGAWEYVVWELGKASGLDLPECELLDLGGEHRTFLARRFDRMPGSRASIRRHFASAMAMLGYSDGADHQAGVSYLELCEWISNHGAQPSQDLPELWKRIVFSIFVSNTDDHLRNHGFLLTPEGWKLSPAYDLNPEPSGVKTGLSLNIDEVDNRLDPDLALGVAKYFRVDEKSAKELILRVRSTVSNWRAIAQRLNIRRAELEIMEPAFGLTT